jgi:glyoxylase-like metal-dependent hydrolase (beta-lactamase superfamily II)
MNRKLWILAAAILATTMVSAAERKPVKLAEGVWAVDTAGLANAGWFTFGDSVVAVDSGKSDYDAQAILAAIDATTGKKPISFLILTNNFTPHAGGAAEFSRRGATIICQEGFGPEALTLVSSPFLDLAKAHSARPTVLSVDRRLVLADSGRRAEIAFAGSADSGVDLVVYLPNDKVLFSGDLAVNAVLPLLFSKRLDPDGWLRALDHLTALPVTKLVPGYGPIGPVEGLKGSAAYLSRACEIARLVAAENTPEKALPMRFDEPDTQIKGLPPELREQHKQNMVAFVKFLRAKSGTKPAPAPKK